MIDHPRPLSKTNTIINLAMLDAALAHQATEMIATLQARGEVRADLDAGALGQLVFNNLNMMFVEFVKDEDMTLTDLRARVTAQTRPLTLMIVTEVPS